MTEIKAAIRRETAVSYRGRTLVVTLNPRFIEVAEKGSHADSVTLGYADLYELMLKVRAREQARERAS